MSTEIKNQNTLFRFVSLRNPELVTKRKIRTCFVFHPSLQNSIFYENMQRKGAETKWQNLENTASAFNSIKSEEEIQRISNDIYENSIWLSENRLNTDYSYLSKIVNSNILDLKIEISLWDNLFYQVVTQENFYLKEKIIQILTFNHLAKTYKELNTQKGINNNLFEELKNAQIVLPVELFEETKELNANTAKESVEKQISEEQINDQTQTAQSNIQSLTTLKSEILVIEKLYTKEYKRNYEIELVRYNESIEPFLSEYQEKVDEEKRKICDLTDNKETFETYCNQPNVKYPKLPKFTFDFPQPIDAKSLQSKLTKESFATLKRINALENNDTFQDIYEVIENEVKKENEIITNNFNFSNSVMLIGGVLIGERRASESNKVSVNNKQAFVPEKFGVRNIGIADYKKVVSHVCCYDAGEVSHIENIMAKELRSKETERIHKSEVTTTTEQTNESENFHDITSTERFEMQTEVAKILQENESFAANASVGYSGFGFSANIGANYATSTSKEESNRQAINYAKDITQKATEKIVSRLRTEKVTKITDEFKEKNVHTFDNTKGINHISGVFRFVNSIYKNQIYNYGKRLMYEFMIPQPSKLHKLGMEQNKSNPNAVFLQKPTDPRIQFPDANSINEFNYKALASKYGAEVSTFPEKIVYISKGFSGSKAFENECFNESIDLPIPKGYFSTDVKLKVYTHWDNDNNQWHSFGVTVGNQKWFWEERRNPIWEDFNSETQPQYKLDKFVEKIAVAYQSLNYLTFNITISIKCELTNETIENWKKETFDAIIKGYENQLNKFNSQISDIQSLESNPGFYRQIENTVLRKNCITYLINETSLGQLFYTGNSLSSFSLIQNQQLDNYANLVKFMEQAFEWSLMSYNFYPFYWGNRNDWTDLYQYECNDPLFRSFMQSGMARVVVTVKPGFEKAVLHFMATGQIWNGGEVPVLGNPLYLSIVDELKEQEYIVEETWETVVPTNLIALQSSGVAVEASGLPCGEDCNDFDNPLKPNANTMEANG